jgi:hypothetical protein
MAGGASGASPGVTTGGVSATGSVPAASGGTTVVLPSNGGVSSSTGGAPSPVGGAPGSGGVPGNGGAVGGGGSAGNGVGGAAGVAGGASGGTGAAGSSSGGASGAGGTDCTSLPPVTDYTAPGPFTDAKMFKSVGPSSNYTLFRPDASLGKNGFRHPVATWGNGILTTPDQYEKTLDLLASHGFVIIACNDTMAERPCLSDGMDWLVAQNTTAGPMQGKLDTDREVVVGYSWGGGAAIDTSNRPHVKATVSLHGMPPRVSTAFTDMHAPLLLFTSTGDSFVTASEYVTPNYEKSVVQTFYATLNDSMAGHLYVVDVGASICIGSIIGFGACGGDTQEHAPTIAFLRYFACGDQGAKKYFYGSDCTLCKAPWETEQRKPMDQWN